MSDEELFITEHLKEFFNKKSSEFHNLTTLWLALDNNIFPDQMGPLVAGHGKPHIKKVLKNLIKILRSFNLPKLKAKYTDEAICDFFAATMIHDSAMTEMKDKGATGEASKKVRKAHANRRNIEKAVRPILEPIGFFESRIHDIIDIAAAHDGDDENDAETKLHNIKSRKSDFLDHLYLGTILLRCADFHDIGVDRVRRIEDYKKGLKGEQLSHYIKHQSLRVIISEEQREVSLYKNPTSPIDDQDQSQILNQISGQSSTLLSHLNTFSQYMKGMWTVKSEQYARIIPLGNIEWIHPFTDEFTLALEDWTTHQTLPMPIDMMGHSLFARFVKDSEDLNAYIKEHLRRGHIDLRVLILDPYIENQQMFEVCEAQQNSHDKKERGRSILPLYDGNWEVMETKEGDIRKALKEVKEWKGSVDLASSIEVKGTTRLMYMSMTRFGNRMVLTPYSNKGLFNTSFAILVDNKSQLFYNALEEFTNIWDNNNETRLLLHKHNVTRMRNPILPLLMNTRQASEVAPAFNYEAFLLEHQLERIKRLFRAIHGKTPYAIPPFEIEIQPSIHCAMRCDFCIGAHLRKLSSKVTPPSDGNDWEIDSLFCEVEGFKVERFRISGLVGDPLSDETKDFTMQLIEQIKTNKRELVVFTNGATLDDKMVVESLCRADYIHISLDAASGPTFIKLKNPQTLVFEDLIFNIKNLSKKIKETGHTAKIGIGFVVTQGNAFEVEAAIRIAHDVGARFIRFKPDIRRIGGISFSTWKKAEAKIRAKQSESKRQKTNSGDTCEIILTDVPIMGSLIQRTKNCWLQYLCSTIGPNGNVYACDHSTANGDKHVLGSLKNQEFDTILLNRSPSIALSASCHNCFICPPFGWRTNRLLDELFLMEDEYKWEKLEMYISEALKTVK